MNWNQQCTVRHTVHFPIEILTWNIQLSINLAIDMISEKYLPLDLPDLMLETEFSLASIEVFRGFEQFELD